MRVFIIFQFLLLSNFCFGQIVPIEGMVYTSGEGESIYMPLGEISFADRVVSYNKGKPSPLKEYTNPREALGEPDYVNYRVPRYVSLGCYGSIVLEFTDNGFIDMEGDDLYVWEVGPSEEGFQLEISKDGKEWLDLGNIPGGRSYVDIAPVVNNSREVFYFVRITDIGEVCTGKTAGADLDAVGTISGVIKINLSADILFEVDKFALKKASQTILEELAQKIEQVGIAEILIQGHTDSDGSTDYNLVLSQNRANSVLAKLKEILSDSDLYTYETESFGKSQPRATNETAQGKQQNRRVEIVVLPHKEFYKQK